MVYTRYALDNQLENAAEAGIFTEASVLDGAMQYPSDQCRSEWFLQEAGQLYVSFGSLQSRGHDTTASGVGTTKGHLSYLNSWHVRVLHHDGASVSSRLSRKREGTA